MNGSTAPASFELAEYGAVLRRRWRLVLIGMLAGLVLSGGYVLLAPKTYTSTASVLVTPTGTQDETSLANGRTKTEINLDTEAQLARSIVVASAAAELLKTDTSPQDLLDHVDVSVPPNSAVLAVSYDDATPRSAQRGAHTFAEAYLSNRRDNAKAGVNDQVNVLQNKVEDVTNELQRVTVQLDSLAQGSPERAYAKARQGLLTRQISHLNDQISTLTTTTITPGRIISDAQLPTAPSSPILPLYLGSGFMAGLLVGLIAAVLRDRADNRIRRAGDVERLLRLPVLLDVPTRDQRGRATLLPARSQAGQAFHELSHSLTAMLGHGNHVVLVTSASSGDGTATVAANLAAALARTGSNAVLVCADLQSTVSAEMFALQSGPGLSDILLHGMRVSAVEQRPIDLPRLRVVAPGHDGEFASDQLQTQAMERFVAELRGSVRFVILEAPPTSSGADAQALADVADAAIIVVEALRAERGQVQEGIRQIDRMGTAVLGAVVVPHQEEPVAPQRGTRAAARAPRPSRSPRAARPSQPARSQPPGTRPVRAVGHHTAPLAELFEQSKDPAEWRDDPPEGTPGPRLTPER